VGIGVEDVEWEETCNVTSPYWYAVLTRLTLSKAVMLIANQGGTERRLMKPGMSTSSPGRLGISAETTAWARRARRVDKESTDCNGGHA
jgi:hypothetical protein